MNKLSELSYNVDALHHVVRYHTDFFAPISSYSEKLKNIVVNDLGSASKDEILYLAKKIVDFFQSYRPSGSGLYIPPTEASNNDDTAKEIFKLAQEIHQLSDDEFEKQNKKIQ